MRLHGLYVITAADTVTAIGLTEQVAQAIAGGARVIQYRDKSGDPIKRLAEADALNRLCRTHGVPLLINDDVELAARVGAAGVHLGQDDADLAEVKRILTDIATSDERVMSDPAPQIAVSELADSSVNFVVRPWVKTPDYWGVMFDLTEAIKKRFDQDGISFPFPQQDVHLYKAD